MSVLLCKSGAQGRWDLDRDPTGYWVSVKLDGIRGRRDKNRLFSRNNLLYPTPSYFFEGWPDMPLDGELFLGNKRFEETSSIVRNGSQDKGWNTIKYYVFDIPDPTLGTCEKRWEILQQIVNEAKCTNLVYVPQTRCLGKEHLINLLDSVTENDFEGLMLRRPNSIYEPKRSSTLFKLKKFLDAEAVVIGYEELDVQTAAKEHLRGCMGRLTCKLPNGIEFGVGSGFTDAQRINPPKIGSTITFRYQELTKTGTPRFPRFVAVRDYE